MLLLTPASLQWRLADRLELIADFVDSSGDVREVIWHLFSEAESQDGALTGETVITRRTAPPETSPSFTAPTTNFDSRLQPSPPAPATSSSLPAKPNSNPTDPPPTTTTPTPNSPFARPTLFIRSGT
jgi:hypothetical protein